MRRGSAQITYLNMLDSTSLSWKEIRFPSVSLVSRHHETTLWLLMTLVTAEPMHVELHRPVKATKCS